MTYFDYLRMQRLADTKENYIGYLVEIVGYTENEASQYADIFGGF